MIQIPKDILTLTSEAAVLVHAGRAAYANHAALAVLGKDCLGKSAAELFGEDVAGTQANTFLAQIRIQKAPYTVRVIHAGSDQLYFLRPQEELPAVLNQPFLYALRSALMNMQLSSDLMRNEAEAQQSAPLLENLRAITRAQYQILRLVDNASLILGAAEGSAVYAPQRFSLSHLFGSMLEAVQDLIPWIRIQAQLGKDILIDADPSLMKSLLLNLLSNAILHARGCTRISVNLIESRKSVVLAVDDDGCGIAPDALYEVFDRYRYSFDLSQMSTGPGLGLTVARLITQLHGGTLLLESRLDMGTTIRASLSKEERVHSQLRAGEETPQCQAKDLLTGLADCLPPDCFREQYLD